MLNLSQDGQEKSSPSPGSKERPETKTPREKVHNLTHVSGPQAHRKRPFKEIILDGRREERTARYVLHRLCDELAARANLEVPRRTIPTAGLFRAFQLSALDRVSERTRLAFLRAMFRVALDHRDLSRTAESLSAQALSHVSHRERLALGRELLNWVERRPSHSTAQQLLRCCIESSSSHKELRKVVNHLSPTALKKIRSPGLRHLVALSELGRKLSQISPPALLNKFAPAKTVTRCLNQIRDCLKAREECLNDEGEHARTAAGARFSKAAEFNQEYLSDQRRRRRVTRDRRELANMMIRKIKLETAQNILLSSEQDEEGKYTAHWREQDIKQMENLFGLLSGMKTSATPKLAQIRLEESLAELTYGQRDGTGIVRIASSAVDASEVSQEYNNINSLKLVVLHEIGHSLKFGRWGDGRKRKQSIEELSDESNPTMDYQDFMALSSWQVVPPDEFRVRNGKQSVRIDGEEYCIGDPVEYGGRQVIFRYDEDQKTLYTHDANAKFPVQQYGRTNPWEDWTESFTDYVFLPERLIEFAPWKFVYFDQRFGLHAKRADLAERLGQELPELGGFLEEGKR